MRSFDPFFVSKFDSYVADSSIAVTVADIGSCNI